MNNIIVMGRLTRDPELRYIPATGKAVCNITVAVNRRFKKDETDFFNVTVWDKQGENVANYLAKGSQCIIKGSMQQRNYTDKEGKKVYAWDLMADEVEFIGGKAENKPSGNWKVEEGNSFSAPVTDDKGYQELITDDLPF